MHVGQGLATQGMQSILKAEVLKHSATALLRACHTPEVKNITDADMCCETMRIMQRLLLWSKGKQSLQSGKCAAAHLSGCSWLLMSTARDLISVARSRSSRGTSHSKKTQHQYLPCSVGSSCLMMLLISQDLPASRDTSTRVTFLPPPAGICRVSPCNTAQAGQATTQRMETERNLVFWALWRKALWLRAAKQDRLR